MGDLYIEWNLCYSVEPGVGDLYIEWNMCYSVEPGVGDLYRVEPVLLTQWNLGWVTCT